MALYLSLPELTARLHLGKEVAQWLGVLQETDYTVLTWLFIAREAEQQYSVNYVESFDEGDADWHLVSEFSLVDPDAEVSHCFDSVAEAVDFAVQTYKASVDRFIAGSMMSTEYAAYWQSKEP